MVSTLKLSGVRGFIAKKMHKSLQETAQLSFFCDCDASALVVARSKWKSAGFQVGYEDLVIHTLARVLPEYPLFNAIETDTAVEPSSEINVCCAIAVGGNLMAPAIFDAGAMTVEAIAEARADLVARARNNRLTHKEMNGGSITISNLGLTRVRHFTPILNSPQQTIIGLGQIVRRPWVERNSGDIVARDIMGLSLTVDHRVIDGAPAGEFLTALADALESEVACPA